MTRLSRYAAKLSDIDREVVAFVAYLSEECTVSTGQHAGDALPGLARQFRAALTADLYAMHTDSHLLGVLHKLDNGARLTGMGWRWAEGCGP